MKQVSIIGCGWLGFPLAISLIKQGYIVRGSTTSKHKLRLLREKHIIPFLINLKEQGIDGDINRFLENSDVVIINIPPGLRKNPNKNHVSEIGHLAKAINNNHIKNVIYVSSTSVFKDESEMPIISSETIPNNTEQSNQLIEIENLLTNDYPFKTSIIRFGGLIDDTRHPGNYLSGKKNIINPEAPINLIHKEDCINIISEVIKKEIFNENLNAVYPSHPTRKSYYTNYCRNKNLPLPTFDTTDISKGKIIDSSTLIQLLNYTFEYPI